MSLVTDLVARFRPPPPSESALQVKLLETQVALRDAQLEVREAQFGALELQLELQAEGMVPLGETTMPGGVQLTRRAIGLIVQQSRAMYRTNPLINRAVSLGEFYIWGRGVSVQAPSPAVNDLIQAFIDDEDNQAELFSEQAREQKERERATTGNVFLALFTKRSNGRVKLRSIPVEEIQEIICDPNDAQRPWFYKRMWSMQSYSTIPGVTSTGLQSVYYPDWKYPANLPRYPQVNGVRVQWDTPVYHVKTGGFTADRFGISDVFPALPWAREARNDLETYRTIHEAISRFATQTIVKGPPARAKAVREKINTAMATGVGGGVGAGAFLSIDTNPPPVTGAGLVTNDAVDYRILGQRGMTPDPEDGRRLWLMVCAATGWPITFFGDADLGNHATAKTLDRPTQLRIAALQLVWRDVYRALCNYQIDQSVLAPEGYLQGARIINQVGDEVIELAPDLNNLDPETSEPLAMDRTVNVDFPNVLEQDQLAIVGAIVEAATLGGRVAAGVMPAELLTRLILTALEVKDPDEWMDKLFPTGADEDGEGALTSSERAAFAGALRELREALEPLATNGHVALA